MGFASESIENIDGKGEHACHSYKLFFSQSESVWLHIKFFGKIRSLYKFCFLLYVIKFISVFFSSLNLRGPVASIC